MDKARVRDRVRIGCNHIDKGVHTYHSLRARVSIVLLKQRKVVRVTLM